MTRHETHVKSQVILLLDSDPMITDGLALGLEREGRSIITCNDVESARKILERVSPSHIVSDVRTGALAFEGLDFIRYARRHSPASQIILMSADRPDSAQREAAEEGAVAFLQKPFELHELEAIIDLMDGSPEDGFR